MDGFSWCTFRCLVKSVSAAGFRGHGGAAPGLGLTSEHPLVPGSQRLGSATALHHPPEEWAGQTLGLGLTGPTPPVAAALQASAQPGRSERPPLCTQAVWGLVCRAEQARLYSEVSVSQSFFFLSRKPLLPSNFSFPLGVFRGTNTPGNHVCVQWPHGPPGMLSPGFLHPRA